MTKIVVQPNASGTGTFSIAAPNSSNTQTLTLPDATTTLVGTDATQTLTNKTLNGGAITRATAVASTSGTNIDFTGIPSWVKRISLIFENVSTNSTSPVLIQLGDAGGVETTGYDARCIVVSSSNVLSSSTNGFAFGTSAAAAYSQAGTVQFLNIRGNVWVASGLVATNTASGQTIIVTGTKELSDTLDRIRVTTVLGTPTFDAGNVNIMYEG